MLSIDVGFGNTKIYDGEHSAVLPSVYSEKDEEVFTPSGPNDIVLTLDGTSYYIGVSAIGRDGTSSFDRTDMLRQKLMILTGICCMTDSFKGEIAVGLPIVDMISMKSKIEGLRGVYNVQYNGKDKVVEITKLNVLPQGGAIFHVLLSKDTSLLSKEVGIIDIGQKTMDFCWFSKGTYSPALSSSSPNGCFQAYNRIRSALNNLENPINCQMYQVRNYMDKVPEARDKAFDKLARDIKAVLANAGWQFGAADNIYIAGGGAEVMEKSLKKLFPCEKIDNPVFSNAEGFYKKASDL